MFDMPRCCGGTSAAAVMPTACSVWLMVLPPYPSKPIAHPVLLARDPHSLDYGLSCWRNGMWLQDQEKFDILPEADDDENDMLDLAFALTDT